MTETAAKARAPEPGTEPEPGDVPEPGNGPETGNGPGANAQADAPPPNNGSIRATFAELIDAGRDLADAELSWAKLKAASIAKIASRGIVFAVSALVLLMMGVMLLIVAAIVALAPLVGLLIACLIVAGVAVVLAILLALAARRAFAALFDGESR